MGTAPRVRIGSVKFHFLAGATAPVTLNTASLYTTKFPECPAEFSPNMKSADIMEPSAGVNVLVGSPITESLPEYSMTLKRYNDNVTALFLGGAAPSGDTEPTSINVGTNFSFIGWGLMEWYENGDVAGTPYRVHAGFKCQLVPEGSLSRDPSKGGEPKIKVRLIGQGAERGIYSSTGA
jgi:hypothetical protein